MEEFEKKIGIKFNNIKTLENAFVHRSYLNENKEKFSQHNERMEFLGDAVLELCATDFLYKNFPQKKEGELTAIRSALVNTESLCNAAKKLNLEENLLMSKGESLEKKGRNHILANTFEALVGAIYLDGEKDGFFKAYTFLENFLFDYAFEIVEKNLFRDPKSYFQEIAQEVIPATPEYKLISEKGPDHDKNFIVGAYIGDEKISEGEGKSKQKAEVDAAKKALIKKGWE